LRFAPASCGVGHLKRNLKNFIYLRKVDSLSKKRT